MVPVQIPDWDPERVVVAKGRLLRALDATLAKIPEVSRKRDGRDLLRMRGVVERLPDLTGLLSLAVEMRAPILDALTGAGLAVPYDVWARFGLGWAAR